MQQHAVSKALLWTVRVGIWLLLFTPLVVAPTWFFPYITGKGFFFRIVVEMFFGVWLALIALDARFRPRSGFVLWAFLGFISILGLATIFGADPYQSFWSNFERMEGMVTYLHLAALFLMASSVFRNVSDWRLTFHISLAASFIVGMYGFLELMNIIAIPGSTAGMSGIGIFSRLGNQIYLAAYLLFHFFILGFLFFTTRTIWWRVLYTFLGLFEFYIFLHTGTRGALIGLVAGCAATVFTLFLFSLRDNKRLAVYMGGVMAVGVAVLIGFFMIRDSAFVARYPLLQRFADINTQSSTAQSRLMIWGIAKEAFKERPVLGWGPGNFLIPYTKYYNPNLYGSEPWYDRVHNMHLEWLVAAGVAGFLAYLLVIGSSLYGLWQAWRSRVLHPAACALLVGFLIAYLVQNTFVFDNVITYLFFVLFLAFVQSVSVSMIRDANGQDVKKKTPAQSQGGYPVIFASLCIIGGIAIALTAHTKQIQVAGGIIDMLSGTSAGGTALGFTNKVDAMVAQHTFGTGEVRERFVDVLLSVTRQKDQASASDLLFLLSHGIGEIRKESERNPDNVRSLISLAKLLQLRFTVSGSQLDHDESIAVYEEAIKKAPKYPSSYIGLAEVYLVAGDTKKASDVMDSIFQEMLRPNTFIYPLLSVSILNSDWERAIQQVRRYESLGNTPLYPAHVFLEPEKLDEVIKRSFAINDPQGRERFLQALLEVQEESATLLGLAETAAELKKWDEVNVYISRARTVARPAQLPVVEEFEKQLHK
ncbi:MAG: hypothetical protein A2719_01735 [Candidatus Ryanbacteria bacterium RIFCSPHIGHO2_01_FULL_45_22]|uniref:O-antigen ligase-related domain-containing protein n=2 Tax=Candidatus Ryaniibacteriota TaxID=1817914 RepID=A0A1G2FYB2_9BACT|nr:MAG: hypothetical protein A2719_01735 [Candidatus Ryanbacteria bacterium RIFCSPHIGHO2_01_FULL_45_22]OGZ45344.1 MAG: hypothetical protein A3J54_03825 [Candidatus Ryanbacteria bacterium RIFCSPHIGHO2_02_FULL_45_13b]